MKQWGIMRHNDTHPDAAAAQPPAAAKSSEQLPRLLELYDTHLRTHAEVATAPQVTHIGPLWVAVYPETHAGFITYQHLPEDRAELTRLFDAALAELSADPQVAEVEWKTRGHDNNQGLRDLLLARGFHPEEEETVMLGSITDAIAADVTLPAGYTLHEAHASDELRDAVLHSSKVFGTPGHQAEDFLQELLRRQATMPDSFAMWVVRNTGGKVVCSGRVEYTPGVPIAGMWGGGTSAQHRGLGLYRALTAARARQAASRGITHLFADCTQDSRPILGRAGLRPVTTTQGYVWRRPTCDN